MKTLLLLLLPLPLIALATYDPQPERYDAEHGLYFSDNLPGGRFYFMPADIEINDNPPMGDAEGLDLNLILSGEEDK